MTTPARAVPFFEAHRNHDRNTIVIDRWHHGQRETREISVHDVPLAFWGRGGRMGPADLWPLAGPFLEVVR